MRSVRICVGTLVLLALVWALTPAALAGPKAATLARSTAAATTVKVPPPQEVTTLKDLVPDCIKLMKDKPVPAGNALGLTGSGTDNWLSLCLYDGIANLRNDCETFGPWWEQEVQRETTDQGRFSKAHTDAAVKFWRIHAKSHLAEVDVVSYRGERHLIGAAQAFLKQEGLLKPFTVMSACTNCMQIYMDCAYCYAKRYCNITCSN